jgi:murein hydrolase activator
MRRERLALPAIVAACLAGGVAAPAQAPSASPPRPPGEIPYLPFPPGGPLPGMPAIAPPPALRLGTDTPSAPPTDLDTIKKRDRDLQAIRSEQKKASETQTRLKSEIDAIGDDRRKLNQQLIDTAARIRGVEDQVAGIEERLKPLDERAHTLQASLDDRRAVMAEVLAALQRIGRHPPPALLVAPADALESVRSAMLLGAVLPEMRDDANALIADLAELARLRAEVSEGREALDRDHAALAEEQARLTLLTEERQKQEAQTQAALADERRHATDLARQAESLQDLIASIEQDRNPAGGGQAAPGGRPNLAALNDPGRLAPAVAFGTAKGMLPLPVNGARLRAFGAPDGIGGTEKGISLGARPGAQITAPCDGWVVYAGPFRNYGQLLILNAGGGYHVLLAGMERISVDLGQFVVTGEPVATMGGGAGPIAAALGAGSGRPVLYVEFRKDGTPVDPSPWWATNAGEKVRG